MENIIAQMLSDYEIKSKEDGINSLKEVLQEVVLCGLSRGGFFKEAAFYGGTALRIFYGLDRFSEDLDFSLVSKNASFSFAPYFSILDKELKSLGLHFTIEEKLKEKDSNIKSAFLKGDTKENVLTFFGGEGFFKQIAASEVIKLKFEIDVNPPRFAGYEHKYGLLPMPYQLRLYDLPSLFAGKIHAILCRSWKNRVKGRDLYDYVFYLKNKAGVNLTHLKARLVDSNFIGSDVAFNLSLLKQQLAERFSQINYDQAKEDVFQFIKDKNALDLWNSDFFVSITENYLK